MGKTLTEIAEQLKHADKKVQLIYAFNGSGKTRLSREFKNLIASKAEEDEEDERRKILARRYCTTTPLPKTCFTGITTLRTIPSGN